MNSRVHIFPEARDGNSVAGAGVVLKSPSSGASPPDISSSSRPIALEQRAGHCVTANVADRQADCVRATMAGIYREMARGWTEGAEIWRDLAESWAARGDEAQALFCGQLALQRDEWALADAALADEWERRQRDAGNE